MSQARRRSATAEVALVAAGFTRLAVAATYRFIFTWPRASAPTLLSLLSLNHNADVAADNNGHRLYRFAGPSDER